MEIALCFENEVLVFGTQEWIIHANELNWFKLKESPTNIIFFPLYFARKSNALNLNKNKNSRLLTHTWDVVSDIKVSYSIITNFRIWYLRANRMEEEVSYLGKEQVSGCHLYFWYCVSGRPYFWQLNCGSMKGQEEGS